MCHAIFYNKNLVVRNKAERLRGEELEKYEDDTSYHLYFNI